MKMQTLVRMHMLMGLGAALFLASSVRAQQDVDPTTFDINPGTAKLEQATAPRPVLKVEAAKSVASESMISAALWSKRATKQETGLPRFSVVDTLVVLILVAGAGLIVAYAKIATRRERHLQPVLRDTSYGPASSATTH
jgi:hypothetical protein